MWSAWNRGTRRAAWVGYHHEALPIELPYLIDNTRIAKELGVVHRDPEIAYATLAAQSRQEAGV